MNHLYYYRSPQKGTRGPIVLLLFASFLMFFLEPSCMLAQMVVDKPSQSSATDSIGIKYNDGDSSPQGFLRKGSESAAAAAGTNGGKMDDENIPAEQHHGQEPIGKDPVTTNVQNQDESGENSQGHQKLQTKNQRGLKHYKGYGYNAYPKAYKGYGYYGAYYGSSYYGRSYSRSSYYGSSYYGGSYYGKSYYGSYNSPYSYVPSNYRVPYSYSYVYYRAPRRYSPYGYGYRERD